MTQTYLLHRTVAIAVLCVFAAGWLIACAGPAAVSSALTPWYETGSGAYHTAAGKLFFGVGAADRRKNRSLQRVNADNQARHEMGKVLAQYSKALAVTATQAGDGGLALLPREQVQSALHSLVRQALRRAIVSDHWVHPQDGRMMALCTLSLEQFKTTLAEDSAMDPQLRSAMQDHAEALYSQLAVDLQTN